MVLCGLTVQALMACMKAVSNHNSDLRKLRHTLARKASYEPWSKLPIRGSYRVLAKLLLGLTFGVLTMARMS